ncbi:MAG: PspA/IM30 family protein [Candidatus Riflebacteria bacterium]|nr:PspA/IM30 family protein [Candidatus Riflebacteria bacterium]
MGLWERIRRIFTANINTLLDKAEDPELVLKQTIDDMREEYSKTKGYVAEAMVQLKRLERDTEKHEKLASGYHQKARQILSMGGETNDFLAKEALQRQKENEQISAQYKTSAAKQRQAVEQLKSNLIRMERKIQEAERKKTMLTAELRVAETRQRIADITAATHSLPASEPYEAFRRVSEKIEDMSVRAEVASELSAGEQPSVPLLIEDVSFGAEVENEYERLKAELAKK